MFTEIFNNPDLSLRQKQKLTFEAEKILGKKDLYYLAKNILGYKDLIDDYHKPICDTLNYYNKDWQLHLHPRGHFKSTIITISEAIQDLLNNPNETILITNAVLGNSISFLREIKSHFLTNEKFRALYSEYIPRNNAEEGTQEAFTIPARTEKWIREASIEVSGIDKAVVSRHYSKIIFDDVVNDINSSTTEQREKIVTAFKQYLSLLNPGGRIRIVGTRWHYYDLYGYLLDEIKKDRRNNKSPKFKIFMTSCCEDEDLSKPVFKERFTPEILQNLRDLQGSHIFGCQYFNNPQPEEDKIFSSKDLRYTPEPFTEKGGRLFQFCSTDPSVAESEKSDPCVIITVAVNSDRDIFITDIVRDWLNPDAFIDRVLTVNEAIRPLKFGFEAVAFQKVLKFFLEKEMRYRGLYVPIIEVKRSAHVKKHDRIKRIQPYIKNGQIYLCCDPDNLTEVQKQFLEELDTFPYGRYDDILDALADVIEIQKAPSTAVKFIKKYEKIGNSPYSTGYRYKAVLVPTQNRYQEAS